MEFVSEVCTNHFYLMYHNVASLDTYLVGVRSQTTLICLSHFMKAQLASRTKQDPRQ